MRSAPVKVWRGKGWKESVKDECEHDGMRATRVKHTWSSDLGKLFRECTLGEKTPWGCRGPIASLAGATIQSQAAWTQSRSCSRVPAGSYLG